MFRSGKTLPEKAQDERAKLEMKRIRVEQARADRDLITENQKRAAAIRRLTA